MKFALNITGTSSEANASTTKGLLPLDAQVISLSHQSMKEALFFATSHWRLPLLIIGFSYPVGKIHLAGFLDFVDPSRSCETPGGLAGLGGSLTQLCSALRSADQRLEGFSGFPTPKQLLGSKNHFFFWVQNQSSCLHPHRLGGAPRMHQPPFRPFRYRGPLFRV